MGLTWGGLIENDITLDEQKINGQRKFANKIWNVARFVLSNKQSEKVKECKSRSKNTDDQWILEELKKTIKSVTKDLNKYRLNEAAEEIYDFIWHKFADKYIERVKELKSGRVEVRERAIPVLNHVLDISLRLLHPFMPFVTEQIWKEMGNEELLISSEWPKA
jgi:valyl-tRNA synthetase